MAYGFHSWSQKIELKCWWVCLLDYNTLHIANDFTRKHFRIARQSADITFDNNWIIKLHGFEQLKVKSWTTFPNLFKSQEKSMIDI